MRVLAIIAAALAPSPASLANHRLRHDWCSERAYRAALATPGLSANHRRGLRDARRLARAHPRGCRGAMRAARGGRGRRWPRDYCPALESLRPGDRKRSIRVVARMLGGRARPIALGVRPHFMWRGQCDRSVVSRELAVAIQETRYSPAVSAGQRLVAVGRIGGRLVPFTVLH